MTYTEKRLEEYCKKFGLCKEKGTCQCKKELKFIADSIQQALSEERKMMVGKIEKYNDEQKSTAIWSDEYRDGFDHAFGGIWDLLSSLDKPLTDKE